MSTKEGKVTIISLLLILTFGISIRLYNLGSHNLWYDEFLSYYFAKFSSLADLVILDFHPPFYFALLKLWVNCFGTSEFALRSLSMIFGAMSIFAIYKLGRLFFNVKTGLASAFILSISPIHIWYSQEARGYSLLTFLTISSIYFVASALRKNNIYKWIAFILLSTIALYTSYPFIFIIAISIALFIPRNSRHLLKNYMIALLIILLISFPCILLFLKQVSRINASFWLSRPNLNSIRITFDNFRMGYNSTSRINLFADIIFPLLFFTGILSWWRERKKALLILVLFVYVPIISVFLISQKIPIYLDRQLLLVSPFYYIIIAAGLEKIKIGNIKIFIYLSIFIPTLFCLNNYFSNRMPLPQVHHMGALVKKTVKPAADYINDNLREGDIIATSDKSVSNIFYYMEPYISRRQVVYFFIEDKFRKEKSQYNYDRLKYEQSVRLKKGLSSYIFQLEGKPTIPGIRTIGELDYKRIWLISSSWLMDGVLGEHARAVREYMQRHYALLDHKELDGIIVDLYGQSKD